MQRRVNPLQMIQKFNEFKRSFSGDPKKEVEKLIASGQINQEQLNQLQSMAQSFQSMLNMK